MVEFAGYHHKWRVRQGENVIMSEFQTKDQAERWLKGHIAVQGR